MTFHCSLRSFRMTMWPLHSCMFHRSLMSMRTVDRSLLRIDAIMIYRSWISFSYRHWCRTMWSVNRMRVYDTMRGSNYICPVVMIMIRMPHGPRYWSPGMPIRWIIMIIIGWYPWMISGSIHITYAGPYPNIYDDNWFVYCISCIRTFPFCGSFCSRFGGRFNNHFFSIDGRVADDLHDRRFISIFF